jgi:hypothetical protein
MTYKLKLNVTKNELGPTEVGCSIRLDQSVQNQVMGVYIINKHSFYDRVTIKWVNFDFFFIKRYLFKIIYLYFYENILQDNSINATFTFSNSTI